jgi:hypothetical protein
VERIRVESNSKKRGRENDGGGVREARIAQTGYIHFLIQACRLIVYYSKKDKSTY